MIRLRRHPPHPYGCAQSMKSSIPMQRRYWNRLADAYHQLTRIAVDDFHYGPQIPGESRLQLLPPLRRGQQALELGCGGAQNSLWLARKGLECTALDLSAVQLRHARRLARGEGLALRLVCSPIGLHGWVPYTRSFPCWTAPTALPWSGDGWVRRLPRSPCRITGSCRTTWSDSSMLRPSCGARSRLQPVFRCGSLWCLGPGRVSKTSSKR